MSQLKERLARAAALGCLCGLVAAALIVIPTDDLGLGQAMLLTGLVVSYYVVFCLVLMTVLSLLGGLASRLGASPRAFVSPSFVWGLAALVAGLTIINQANRSPAWKSSMHAWTVPLRLLLAVGLLWLLLATWRAGRSSGAGALRLEHLLALLAIPLLLLGGLYFLAGEPPKSAAVTDGFDAADVLALAPRFAPEAVEPAAAVDRPRIMILGLDGASWDRIEAGIQAGRLPTFERLTRGGRTADLETLTPTYSPAIWTTVATGVPPEVHGIDTFYIFELPRLGVDRLRVPKGLDLVEEFLTASGELRRVPVTSSMRRRKAFWNLADEAGLVSATVGLWATWPPESLANGLVISDHASLAKRHEWLDRRKSSELSRGASMYPLELEERFASLQRSPTTVSRAELAEFVPVDDDLWAEFETVQAFSKDVKLSAFRSSQLNDSFYFGTAERIWIEDQPDVLFVYTKAIDELSHFFYRAGVPEASKLGWSAAEIERYGPVVDRAYEWTDRRLAPLVDLVDADPNTLLIVLSDHSWEREPDGDYNHNHAPPGILILYGADVCREDCVAVDEVSVFDVMPTVLERLGLPLAEEFPGRPLPAFDNPHPVQTVALYGPPLGSGAAVGSELDPELTEKLKALGYLE